MSQKFAVLLSGLVGVGVGMVVAFGLQTVTDQSAEDIETLRAENRQFTSELKELRKQLALASDSAEEFRDELAELEAGTRGTASTRREELLAGRLQAARDENKKLFEKNTELETLFASSSSVNLTPARERLDKMENMCRLSPNWSVLRSATNSDSRTYGHTSGIRVKFWTEKDGTERMRYTYLHEDEDQMEMGAAMWLVVNAIGGDSPVVHEENTDRIENWIENPTPILLLKGGFAHIREDFDGKRTVDVYGRN